MTMRGFQRAFRAGLRPFRSPVLGHVVPQISSRLTRQAIGCSIESMQMRSLGLLGLPLYVSLTLGCAAQKHDALYASSADSPGYATRYPALLEEKRETMATQEQAAREEIEKIKTYPGALESPDWKETARLVDQAEADGKSEAYARELEEMGKVGEFYEQERDEIRRSVAGNVQYAAKQNGCKEGGKLGGAAAHALDKAMEKRQEERLRAASEAHRALELRKERLGKKNADLLGEQLDTISRASYLANVGMESTRRELEAKAKEGASAKSTLEGEIKALEEASKDPAMTDSERKAAENMLDEARVAVARIDAEARQSEQLAKDATQRVDALRKEFDAAMEALRAELERRVEAQPAKASEPGS